MSQRFTALAVVLGALAIALALAYHGRQLAKVSDRLSTVSERLETLEQGTTRLDQRLQKFSTDLPSLVEQGTRGASRQVVHGMFEEAIEKPLSRLQTGGMHGLTNAVQQLVSFAEAGGLFTNREAPWIRFDIPDPVINIHLLPGLTELPDWPWLSAVVPWLLEVSRGKPASVTNQPPSATAPEAPSVGEQ